MKKFLIDLNMVLVLFLILVSAGCKEERTLYDGPNYILFSDSLYVFPVQKKLSRFQARDLERRRPRDVMAREAPISV